MSLGKNIEIKIYKYIDLDDLKKQMNATLNNFVSQEEKNFKELSNKINGLSSKI